MSVLENGNLNLDLMTRHITNFQKYVVFFLFYCARKIADKIHQGNLSALIPESKPYKFHHLLKIPCDHVIATKTNAVVR